MRLVVSYTEVECPAFDAQREKNAIGRNVTVNTLIGASLQKMTRDRSLPPASICSDQKKRGREGWSPQTQPEQPGRGSALKKDARRGQQPTLDRDIIRSLLGLHRRAPFTRSSSERRRNTVASWGDRGMSMRCVASNARTLTLSGLKKSK